MIVLKIFLKNTFRLNRDLMFTNIKVTENKGYKMPGDTGTLSAQLLNKLADQNVSLSSRLEVAFTVFCSSDIPIAQKEEYILVWLLQVFAESTDHEQKELLLSYLLKCFQSKRIQSFSSNMRQSVIEDLLTALSFNEDYPIHLQEIVRKCCVEVFCISFFQRWFMCDVDNACKAAVNYLKHITDQEAAADFNTVIDKFIYIHKMSLLKEELRAQFVKLVSVPMCEALAKIPEEERQPYFDKALSCWKEILLYEPKFMDNYILSQNATDQEHAEVKSFVKRVKRLPEKRTRDVVEIFYSLILKSVISKYPDEYEKIFKVFMSLCPHLGLNVSNKISFEMAPIENWDWQDTFHILTKFVKILDESKMPLTCQFDDITLKSWFTTFVVGVTNIQGKKFSETFLKMLKRIFTFNPLVIEPSCKVLTTIMLQGKEPEVKAGYVDLMESVIKGSSKLQRLQKFIAFLLDHTRDQLKTSGNENVSLDNVLPKEVIALFASELKQVPALQSLAIMRSVIYHLQSDCLNYLEYDTDNNLVLRFGIICELLYQSMWNSNIIDHSVPESVKDKYKIILEDFQVFLQNIGMILQNLHDDRLLEPFFKVCRAFGHAKLLFREYDYIEIVQPVQADLEPTNIGYIHNYLNPEVWAKLAFSVQTHPDCQAAHEFNELLIQKIEAVSQVEEGYEGPGTLAARYLLSHADDDWLWNKLLILASLVQTPELVKLISRLIRHIGSDQSRWLHLLSQEAFTENRSLMLVLAFGLFSRASKKLERNEEEDEDVTPVSRQALGLLPIQDLLEYELSQMIIDNEELKESVEGFLTEMANLLNENLSILTTHTRKVPHVSLIEVAARLPLHHLSAVSQCSILLTATALLYDIPQGSDVDNLLFNLLLKILDGPQKNSDVLLGELNVGTFLKFIASRGSQFRGLRKLMKRICLLAFHSKKSAKSLLSEVKEPVVSDLWITALVIDCLSQYKKKCLGSQEGKKPLERRKCLDCLMEAGVPVLCSEPPAPRHLYSFTVLFSHCLRFHSAYQDTCTKLLPLLSDYIDFAFADYLEGERLIESVVEQRSELADHFPPSLIMSMLREMKVQVIAPTETTTDLFFAAATLEEFKSILQQMLLDSNEEVLKTDGTTSRRQLLLWSQLISALLGNEKSRERDDALCQLMQRLVLLSSSWATNSCLHLVHPSMNIISSTALFSKITLRGGLIDSAFELIGNVPLGPEDADRTLEHLAPTVDAMHSLFRHRTPLLIDRLPAFLQRYRKCLFSLPPLLSPEVDYPFVKRALPVATKLERLATSMVKRSKDLARLAPYLIADLMSIFQQYNLASDIKFVYTNIVNSFLSICDKNAINYLKGVLPTTQQELFNGFFENYNKYHRFTGKI